MTNVIIPPRYSHPTIIITLAALLFRDSVDANSFSCAFVSNLGSKGGKSYFHHRISSKNVGVETLHPFQRHRVIRWYRNETVGEKDEFKNNSDFEVDDTGTSTHTRTHTDTFLEGETEITNEKQIDFDGAGTFGDIMSEPSEENDDLSSIPKTSEVQSGLVTTAGGTIQSQFGHKVPGLSPLERIALTANGNLQRIFSSYYDAPVHVHVDKSDQVKSLGSVWHRTVDLSVFGQNFCTASSVVTVHSSECRSLIESGEVGIGQLFRYLDKLPKFTIIDAGRSVNGGLWRRYILQCNELTCDIHEEFAENAWEIRPRGLDHFDEYDNTF